MLEGITHWGIESVAPLAQDAGRGQLRSFRMVNDLPLTSLLGVSKKAIKIDVAELLSEAKSREIPRLRCLLSSSFHFISLVSKTNRVMSYFVEMHLICKQLSLENELFLISFTLLSCHSILIQQLDVIHSNDVIIL